MPHMKMRTKYEMDDLPRVDEAENYQYLWGGPWRNWGRNPFMRGYQWPAGYGYSPVYYPPAWNRRRWGGPRMRRDRRYVI